MFEFYSAITKGKITCQKDMNNMHSFDHIIIKLHHTSATKNYFLRRFPKRYTERAVRILMRLRKQSFIFKVIRRMK